MSARATASSPSSYTPKHLAEKILTSKAALEGERKQVTVLFADLKGSMELLADRDPEEARKILDPVLERMMEAVHRYEGTVNQVLGDGIMALFGAPIAHEDHAERACYAALAIQEAIRNHADRVRQTRGLEIEIRVGLNSGEVVVRAIGNDLHMDYSALGQTTHLAHRLQQMATAGSIFLTAETLRLAEEVVQVKSLGPMPIKGLSHPVEVFELVAAASPPTRLQGFAARALTRFVGRQTEVEVMRRAHQLAAAGHGQVVAVMGEPGVGKTRLFYEFLSGPWTQGWLLLASQPAPYGQPTPYHPIREMLKSYFQLEARDGDGRIRRKVTQRLQEVDESLARALPAVLALLDVPVDERAWLALDPPQRRQQTLDSLKRLLLRESQVQPVLLACENLHWLDNETQAFLDSLVDSLPTARILLLVNYRPEYRHSWGSRTHYVQFRLDPLPASNAAALLDDLLGNDPTLDPLKRTLIERTEGNPFFLEESVRTLVESRAVVGGPGVYRLDQALAPMHVPATVQAVLAARMDRLPAEEKTLLQTAAVIGKDVPFALLHAVTERSEESLRGMLTHLQTAEFLYETSLFPELEYTFKHALTQEVAYGSLLHERRRALHARILAAIERLSTDYAADQIERLAYHALRSEEWGKALVYCRQAGDKALVRSAYREAAAYFEQALRALRQLPEQRVVHEQGIDLRFALRSALLPSGDFGRMLACLREAETLAEALDDQHRLGQVSRLLSLHFWFMGAHDQAITAGQRAIALATASGDLVRQALANLNLGFAYLAWGDYRQAIDCFDQTMASLAGPARHERFGQVNLPAVTCRAWGAWGHAELGSFAPGGLLGEEAIQIADGVAHPSSLMVALWGSGRVSLGQGDVPRATSLLERALGICEDADLPLWFPMVAAPLGAAYARGGRLPDAVPLVTRAMEHTRTMGTVVFQSLCCLSLGEAQMRAGRLEEARKLAEQALALAGAHQERGNQAYASHLLGEIAAHRGVTESGEAEAFYRQALALAEELGMRPLVAHSHHGLGQLYRRADEREQARQHVTTATTMYREMGMTYWLQDLPDA